MSLLKEIFNFMLIHKKLWLLPIIISMLVLGSLIVFSQSTVVAPFIYTLF